MPITEQIVSIWRPGSCFSRIADHNGALLRTRVLYCCTVAALLCTRGEIIIVSAPLSVSSRARAADWKTSVSSRNSAVTLGCIVRCLYKASLSVYLYSSRCTVFVPSPPSRRAQQKPALRCSRASYTTTGWRGEEC